jgi:hypothetical protein
MPDNPHVKEPQFTIERDVHGSYIARDQDGTVCLLVPTTDARQPLSRASGDVHLTFRSKGTFSIAGEQFSSAAAIVRCENPSLGRTFSVLAQDVAATLRAADERPVPEAVSRALARWEQLLRGKKQLSRDEEIGLWGELWTLLELHDSSLGLAAWRGPDADYVDFVGGGIGIECKAGMRRLEHWISQEQVTRPLGDLQVFILSLWVGIDAVGGSSLPELVDRAIAMADDDAALEAKLLDAGYSHADAHRYKVKLRLLEPPLLFPVNSLPRVRNADPGVSHIRFLATLDEEAALPPEKLVATLAQLCTSTTAVGDAAGESCSA